MKSDLPKYSLEGKIGLAVLNAYWAHAVIYFEDALHEAFYERLILRIIPDAKPFLTVCLGGKTEVVKMAKCDDPGIAPPMVCVVDKDFDDLINEFSKNSTEKLVYLRKHSIENYLCQIDALVAIALEQNAKQGKTKNAYYKLIEDRDFYRKSLLEILLKVGRFFVTARKLRISVRTSKISCSEIYLDASDTFPLPADEWQVAYEREFGKACASKHEWLLDPEVLKFHLAGAYDATDKPWGTLESSEHAVGKHLLGGLIRYVDSRIGSKLSDMDDTELYTRLAGHMAVNELSYLRGDILKIVPQLI